MASDDPNQHRGQKSSFKTRLVERLLVNEPQMVRFLFKLKIKLRSLNFLFHQPDEYLFKNLSEFVRLR